MGKILSSKKIISSSRLFQKDLMMVIEKLQESLMVFKVSLINIWREIRKVIKFISFTVSYTKRFYAKII